MTAQAVDKILKVVKPTAKRDGYIDSFKGFLILWVIHIHTVFWSGKSYIDEPFRQVSLLIDVTTFFFISGYLTQTTNFKESIGKYAKQFKRLYLDYLILSTLILIVLSAAYYFKKGMLSDIPQAIVFMLSVLKFEGEGDIWTTIPAYRGSFWYLWVYFSLLVILPFLTSIYKTRGTRLVILSSLLLLLYVFDSFGLHFNFLLTDTKFIFFYSFIYLLGITYRIESKAISVRPLLYCFLANIGLVFVIFFQLDNGLLLLQPEKFPPSFKYLAYSLILIQLFVLLQRLWVYPASEDKHPSLRFLEWCGQNSYIIYLMQGVVTSVPFLFSELLLDRFNIPTVYTIILLFNLSITLLATWVYLNAKERILNTLRTARSSSATQ